MKKIVLMTCLLVAGMSFGQRTKVDVPQDGNLESVNKSTLKKNDLKLQPVTTNANPGATNKPTTKPGAKSKARSSEEFQASLDGIVRSEYGKTRAAAAKEAPKTDDEANARIGELRDNSKSGIERAEEKIEIAKERLEELKSAGEISEKDYNAKMEELDAMEKRKDSLKSSLN